MVTANLVDAQGNAFILTGILALYHCHGDAVNEKDDIFTVTREPITPNKLFGDFIDIILRMS